MRRLLGVIVDVVEVIAHGYLFVCVVRYFCVASAWQSEGNHHLCSQLFLVVLTFALCLAALSYSARSDWTSEKITLTHDTNAVRKTAVRFTFSLGIRNDV